MNFHRLNRTIVTIEKRESDSNYHHVNTYYLVFYYYSTISYSVYVTVTISIISTLSITIVMIITSTRVNIIRLFNKKPKTMLLYCVSIRVLN